MSSLGGSGLRLAGPVALRFERSIVQLLAQSCGCRRLFSVTFPLGGRARLRRLARTLHFDFHVWSPLAVNRGLMFLVLRVQVLKTCQRLVNDIEPLLLLLTLPIELGIVFLLCLLDDLGNPLGRQVLEVVLVGLAGVERHVVAVRLGCVAAD